MHCVTVLCVDCYKNNPSLIPSNLSAKRGCGSKRVTWVVYVYLVVYSRKRNLGWHVSGGVCRCLGPLLVNALVVNSASPHLSY